MPVRPGDQLHRTRDAPAVLEDARLPTGLAAAPPEPASAAQVAVRNSPPDARLFSRRQVLAGLVAAGAGGMLYANEVSRHEIDVAERTFLIRNLPPAFRGYRIVQISDLHLEEFTEDFFLRKVIERVNTLRPDLVLVTGDFVSRGPMSIDVSLAAAGRCAELLRSLACPLRFGVLGNHDAIVGPRIIRDHLAENGLPVLVNEHRRIERGSDHLYLGGLDDISWGIPNLALTMPRFPDAPVLLMCHEPDYANEIVNHTMGRYVDLVFSGHTHGGQVRVPGLRPFGLPQHGRIYIEGHFALGNTQLYVNRGIGTVGVPFRLNCPPEITVATLMPAQMT